MADYSLADFLQPRRNPLMGDEAMGPQPNALAGYATPEPMPPRSYGKGSVQSIPQEPLGQANALSRFVGSFGQPSLDMMRDIREHGERTGQLPEWSFSDALAMMGTMPMGPFGMARQPSRLMGRLAELPPVPRRDRLPFDFEIQRSGPGGFYGTEPGSRSNWLVQPAGAAPFSPARVDGVADPATRTLQISGSSLPRSERGQGAGMSMYRRMIDEAHRLGYTVRSDAVVSEDAQRIYNALAERGYQVQRNPAATTTRLGQLSVADDAQGVFTVLPPITPPQ